MRKIWLFTVLLTIVSNTFSQEVKDDHYTGLRYSISSSVYYRTKIFDPAYLDDNEVASYEGMNRFSMGLTGDYFFKNHFAFSFGVNYSAYGQDTKWSGGFQGRNLRQDQFGENFYYFHLVQIERKVLLNNVNIPIEIKAVSGRPGRFGLFVSGGAEASVIIRARQVIFGADDIGGKYPDPPYYGNVFYNYPSYGYVDVQYNEDKSIVDQLKSMSLNMLAAGGVIIPFKRTSLSLGLRYEYGLTAIYKSKDDIKKYDEGTIPYQPTKISALGVFAWFSL
jgi:hypothetical protein